MATHFTDVSLTSFLYESFTDNLTAKAGGGQANATPITTECSRVSVVATAGDSVVLPLSGAGLTLFVINHGANPMQVYGLGTDTVDDVAVATGVTQMQGSMVIYTCITAGNWYSQGLATGYSGSYQTMSTKNAITAHAGGTQAGAIGDANAQLPAMINRVTIVATVGDSVVLPLAVAGLQITITNAAANSLNVFPFTGDQINGAGANALFALPAGKTVQMTSAVLAFWHGVLSA